MRMRWFLSSLSPRAHLHLRLLLLLFQAASRPSIRPSGAGSSSKGSNSTSFLTKAELKRQDDKETKKAGEDCFDFLKDPRDVRAPFSLFTYRPKWKLILEVG